VTEDVRPELEGHPEAGPSSGWVSVGDVLTQIEVHGGTSTPTAKF
jgi:hypothetical protein